MTFHCQWRAGVFASVWASTELSGAPPPPPVDRQQNCCYSKCVFHSGVENGRGGLRLARAAMYDKRQHKIRYTIYLVLWFSIGIHSQSRKRLGWTVSIEIPKEKRKGGKKSKSHPPSPPRPSPVVRYAGTSASNTRRVGMGFQGSRRIMRNVSQDPGGPGMWFTLC
ncbi:hypothetical protein F4775DRAFT_563797 [Biscogniauxia sp. FL1348]|nr:hypothetical protein F4775DRAFT_563797 [Biscogniauxia sp. FL1348]